MLFVGIFIPLKKTGLGGFSISCEIIGETTFVFFELVFHATFEIEDAIGEAEVGIAIKDVEFFDVNDPVGELFELVDSSNEVFLGIVVAVTHRNEIVRDPFAKADTFVAVILAFGRVKIDDFVDDGFVELIAGGTGAGEDIIGKHHSIEAAFFLILDVLEGFDVDFAIGRGEGDGDELFVGDNGLEVDTGKFIENVVDAIKSDYAGAPAEFAIVGVVFEVRFGADLIRNVMEVKEGRITAHLPPLLLAVVKEKIMAIFGFELENGCFELKDVFALGAMVGMIGAGWNENFLFVMW